MVNGLLIITNWLKDVLATSRVYPIDAPEKFDPAAGVGYVVRMSGGSAHAEMPISTARFEVRCIASPFGYLAASQAGVAVLAAIHQQTNVIRTEGRILNCLCELWGQQLTDPDTQWAEDIAVYQAQLIDTQAPPDHDIVFINGVELGGSIYINGVFLSDDQILINGIDV